MERNITQPGDYVLATKTQRGIKGGVKMYENQGTHENQGRNELNGKVERESVASVIDKLADKVATMSNDTLQRVNNKLQSISRSSAPDVCDKTPGPVELYPPLFDSLRSSLKTIERSLAGVNDCLDRVEL